MKTFTTKLSTLALSLVVSSQLMAIDVVIDNHVEGALATELSAHTLTDITGLTISGGNLDFTNDAATIKLCTSLETLDISGISFTGNTTPIDPTTPKDPKKGLCNGLTSLKEVILPTTLTQIGSGAFFNCTNLEEINLNDGITQIGDYAFANCGKLTLTSLPSGLKTLLQYAFSNCSSIVITELPTEITGIGPRAFEFCASVDITEIPSGVTIIRERSFDRTGIKNLTLHSGITKIENLGFFHNGVFERKITCRKESNIVCGTTPFCPANATGTTVLYILKKADGVIWTSTAAAGTGKEYITQQINVTYDNTKGSVSVDASAVNPGQVEPGLIHAYEAETITFTVAPKPNCSIEQVLLNGEPIASIGSNQYQFLISEQTQTLAITLDGNPTGIKINEKNDEKLIDTRYYSIQGIEVENPSQGIYIVKKIYDSKREEISKESF